MACCVRVCVFWCFLFNLSAVFGSKEYFCLDPDTEELHHVNTTWPSTRFCGNYTCKLKKRNTRDMETHATDQNYIVSSNPYKKYKPKFPEENYHKSEDSVTTKRESPEFTTAKTRNNQAIGIETILTPKRDLDSNKDRYLNDIEIKAITEVLHTIKKSDIDAIVEVYNLAQDIYKEMETNTVKNEVKLVENMIPESRVSYWYDPMYHTDFTFDSVKEVVQREPTNLISSVVPSNIQPIYPTSYTVQRKSLPIVPYYFSLPVQPLSLQPMPLQPMPLQPLPTVQKAYIPLENLPSNHNPNLNPTCPLSNTILKKQYTFYPYAHKMETVPKYHPLSYSYFHNENYFPKLYRQNFTKTPQIGITKMEAVPTYPTSEEKTLLTELTSNPYSNPIIAQDSSKTKLNTLENELIKLKNVRNIEESKKSQEKLPKSIKDKQVKLAPWQTLPLSQKILDEVKANILESSDSLLKPFQLKKKFKLERVAKVMKVDEEDRKKREIVEVTRGDVLEENDFEVFLEKITCEIRTDPGLFSLGDLSLPFPACCPRKLNTPAYTEITTKTLAGLTTSDISSQTTNTPPLTIPTAETNAVSSSFESTGTSWKDLANSVIATNFGGFITPSSPSSALPTSSSSISTDILKLTTNELGISSLSSWSLVPESTSKISSSSPPTTTSDLPPIVSNGVDEPTDFDFSISELSRIPSTTLVSSNVTSDLESSVNSTANAKDLTSDSTIPTTSEPKSTLELITEPNDSKKTTNISDKFSYLKFNL